MISFIHLYTTGAEGVSDIFPAKFVLLFVKNDTWQDAMKISFVV